MGWGAAEGGFCFLFEHFSHIPACRETSPRRCFNLSYSLDEMDASEHLVEFMEATFRNQTIISVRDRGPTRANTYPLTSIGRCQALGRVGRCRPYLVWALLHVSMWYGLRFYIGSPYHLGPASAHSATWGGHPPSSTTAIWNKKIQGFCKT